MNGSTTGSAARGCAGCAVPSAKCSVIALSWECVRWRRMGSDSLSEECPERRVRTLFISDVHLAARGSHADRLLGFLRRHHADTISLAGAIVDGCALQPHWYLPQSPYAF